MAFGLHNLTNATANASTSPGIEINQTSQSIWQVSGGSVAGGAFIIGLIVLAVVAYILWTAETQADTKIIILTPTTLFLAIYDYLPYSTAVTYASIMIIAGMFAWGFYKYAFR